jgi:hypothetical protein
MSSLSRSLSFISFVSFSTPNKASFSSKYRINRAAASRASKVSARKNIMRILSGNILLRLHFRLKVSCSCFHLLELFFKLFQAGGSCSFFTSTIPCKSFKARSRSFSRVALCLELASSPFLSRHLLMAEGSPCSSRD